MELLYALQRLDGRLFFKIFRQSEKRAVRLLAQAVSRSADGYLYLLVPLLLLLIGADHIEVFVLLAGCTLVLERLLYWSLKNGFRRHRPQDSMPGFRSIITAADKFSFPSGHTSASFVLASSLTLVYQEPAMAMYLWACAVAFSRVVLGVHYPGDTLAGAVMGTSTTLFIAAQLSGIV